MKPSDTQILAGLAIEQRDAKRQAHRPKAEAKQGGAE